MIDLDFNDYFIRNDNCYDLRRHTHHIRPKTRPTLFHIITFSFIELTKFGTICLKIF